MTRLITRPICCLIVFMTAFGAFAQNKISAEDSAILAAMPPLPAIDTAAVPDDELTREVKKLLVKTNAMGAAVATMKTALDGQRQAGNPQIPAEFYDRFGNAIENGRVSRILENLIIKIYRQKFTAGDVKEINKFYDTPAGKKLAAESVYIATTASTEGQKIGQFLGLQIARDMIKEGKWK
jgi:hypothetical protein